MNKFEVSQKVEIHGLPEFDGDAMMNGEVVTVVALPGCVPQMPLCYKVLRKNGNVALAVEKYLRKYPPTLPNGRGDTDEKVSWDDFDKATGLQSIGFRRDNHDY